VNEPNEDNRLGALKMIPPCWARVFKPSAVIKHRYRLTKPEQLATIGWRNPISNPTSPLSGQQTQWCCAWTAQAIL